VGQEQELKWRIQDALRKVQMKTPAKALVWDLLSRVTAETGVIPARWTPSLTELAESTCLGRSTVATYLRGLEATGWVMRERPEVADAINNGRRTQYRLAIGSFDLPPELKYEKHKRKPRKDAAASDSSGAELVQELNHHGSGAELSKAVETGHDGSGAELSKSGHGSGAELSMVQELNSDSSGAEHYLYSSVHQSSSPPTGGDAPAPQPEDGALFGDEQIERKPKPETDNQRANRLAKIYYDRVPMSKFVATSQIVKKAISSKYTDDQITAGLNALADDPGRPLTLTTLRIAIEGGQSRPRIDNRSVSTAEAIAAGWGQKGHHS
jgi:hypothetical protein